MELTSREKNRNNKISLAVTCFSFTVLVLFLMFRNVMFPNANLKPAQGKTFNIDLAAFETSERSIGAQNTGWMSGRQTAAGVNKQLAVSDDDIYNVQNFTSRLLEAYKTNSGKNQQATAQSDDTDLKPGADDKKQGDETVKEIQLGYNLLKRNLVSAPKLDLNTQEEGIVVVEIIVDENGKVIAANPNARGTTTNNSQLKTKAREMAMLSKFSPAEGVEEQRGNIIINFSFN